MDFGDALWWSVTTVATVGYGDRFPTTTEGRLVAAGLMVAGIGLLAVVTAALASWFVDRIGRAEEQTRGNIAELAEEVRGLRLALDRRSAKDAPASVTPDGGVPESAPPPGSA